MYISHVQVQVYDKSVRLKTCPEGGVDAAEAQGVQWEVDRNQDHWGSGGHTERCQRETRHQAGGCLNWQFV